MLNLDKITLDMSDDDIFKVFEDVQPENTKVNTNDCPMCKFKDSIIFDITQGYNVCNNCGVIDKEILNDNPEWTLNEDNRGKNTSRFGCPTNYFLPKSSLGTSIGGNKWSRLNMMNRWGNMPYNERSFYTIMKRIDDICYKNEIPKAIGDNAKILYKRIHSSKHIYGKNKNKKRIIRKKNIDCMIAACLLFGSQLQDNPRSLGEIATIVDLDVRDVTRGCRKSRKILDEDRNNKTIMKRLTPNKSSNFIRRAATKLKMEEKYIKIAKQISNNLIKLELGSSHKPRSIAAMVLLLTINMYNLDIDTKKISKLFKISNTTIKKAYDKIYEYRNILINDKATNMIVKKMESAK